MHEHIGRFGRYAVRYVAIQRSAFCHIFCTVAHVVHLLYSTAQEKELDAKLVRHFIHHKHISCSPQEINVLYGMFSYIVILYRSSSATKTVYRTTTAVVVLLCRHHLKAVMPDVVVLRLKTDLDRGHHNSTRYTADDDTPPAADDTKQNIL